MSRLQIEQYQFGTGDDRLEEYVLINLAVGSQKKPGSMISKLCIQFRENSRLCEMLRSKGIKHDIMPVTVDNFDAPASADLSFDEIESMIDDAKSEAMCYTEELRDEIVDAGVTLKDGPILQDFGFEVGELTVTFEDAPSPSDVEITYSHSENDKMMWIDPEAVHAPTFEITGSLEFEIPNPEEGVEKAALDDVLDNFLKK